MMETKKSKPYILNKNAIFHFNKYNLRRKKFYEWATETTKNIENLRNHKLKDKHAPKFVDISDVWHIDGWNNSNERNDKNFIDLFSGAGGLSCGLVMAGFNPIANVEIMPQALETYKFNFVEKKGFYKNCETRDIRTEKVKLDLYNSVKGKKVNLIVGGFPCQGFSIAGKRLVFDSRNGLYLEMLEIVKRLLPDFVVMENVEGLRTMLKGQVEKKILEDYEAIGYKINVATLNSADYYVPQIRKRVIFIANRIGVDNLFPKPLIEKENYVSIGTAIRKYIDLDEDPTINHIFTKHKQETIRKIEKVEEGESLYNNFKHSWYRSPWNKPSCTIKENHGGVNIHPILNRVLTPRELAALQSFPDDFIFKGSKKWQLVQIGNAVPPLLEKAIGLSIRKSYENKNQETTISKH